MFMKSAVAALTVLMLSTSVQAQTVSAGDAQLAAIAGVAPGALSTADLVNLINARNDRDENTVRFILNKAGIGATRADTSGAAAATGSAWDQVARANGVAPGSLTPAELAQLEYNRVSD